MNKVKKLYSRLSGSTIYPLSKPFVNKEATGLRELFVKAKINLTNNLYGIRKNPANGGLA